jgi:hypothetical protein
MPYKFNASRRHKIPKARYRVANWPEYDAALMRRGDLTVWFTEEAVAAWHAPATGERGGQPVYSSLAIGRGMTRNGCHPGWNDDCGRWMPIGDCAVSNLTVIRAICRH